ncbi:reverse transcriptase domain-containing protein [Desulfobacterales bacterium HSG16]|nr:reverse transcriptase domain-containing protein [Desulfobacterales bacterium HSG16]
MSQFTFENIYRAYIDCRKNKRNKSDALQFEIDAEENIHNLHLELTGKTYHPLRSDCFVARKPKLREIFAADFKDRISHHLVVSYLEPIWEPAFIFDSYASRRKKGIHLAIEKLKKFTRKITKNGSQQAFFMQLDIKNFFMSIDKDILYDIVKTRCPDQEILWLAKTIIFHDPTKNYQLKSSRKLLNRIPVQKSLFGNENEKGLPIGNLTSQFMANVYLNCLDQMVKHELKCSFYMRYVDDFILLNTDEKQLLSWKKIIEKFLDKKLKLELNHSRTKIRPITNGIDFLGYVVRPGYILCRNRVVNNLQKRLISFSKELISSDGRIQRINYNYDILETLFACLNSYLAHFKHANTHNLTNKIFERHSWLGHYFFMHKFKLKRIYCPPSGFNALRFQYRYFQKQFQQFLIFFQVGCFYEFYEIQAARAIQYLKLKRIESKHGFRLRCGIGIKGLDRFVDMALKMNLPVAVIKQTGHYLNRLAERRISDQYIPSQQTTDSDSGFSGCSSILVIR